MSEARQALLRDAISYYTEHGVRDTSLRTLAANIGTSQRMLHYHFGSREDLLAAVIGSVVEADLIVVREIFGSHRDPFAAGRATWEHICGQAQGVGALFFELSSHAMRGLPHAGDLAEVLAGRSEAAFTDAFLTVIDDLDRAARLARLTVAVGRGLLFESLLDGDVAGSDAGLEDFLRMLGNELARTGQA